MFFPSSYVIFHLTREFFTHVETSSLLLKGLKFCLIYSTHFIPLSSESSLVGNTYCKREHPYIMVIFYNPQFYICCRMLMELTLFSLTTFKRLSRQGVEPRYQACKVSPLPTKQGAVREIQKEMEKKEILSERKRGLKRKIGRNSERQRNCQVLQLSMVFSQEATVCSMLVFKIKQILLFFRK